MVDNVLVTFKADETERTTIQAMLGAFVRITFLADGVGSERDGLIESADIVLAGNLAAELQESNLEKLNRARFIQILPAGSNRVPFQLIRADIQVASNVGAYAAPMAEHVLSMILALMKHLVAQNDALRRGIWDRSLTNDVLRGRRAGIVGYGGIGKATAALLRPFEVEIMAINRSGKIDEEVAFAGTLADLETVLRQSDIVVLCVPLNTRTRFLLGAVELAWTKPTAILVNVGRGALVDERALYERAKENPEFRVALDVWWDEPFKPDSFHTSHPILELANVIGSPHNSSHVPGMDVAAVQTAATNVLRYVRGEPLSGLVDRSEYV